MNTQPSILIVDDHPLIREGLKHILQAQSGYRVAGETGTGREALRLVRELKPDLVLLDLGLPDCSGFDITRDIRRTRPETRVLIISIHSKTDYIVEAFQAGAIGYMVKESAAEQLLTGIETVLKGDYFMDARVSHRVVEKLMRVPAATVKISDAAYEALTPREQEVMVLLAEGHTVKVIADRLCVSPKTVENHRTRIMGKLDVHTSYDLIRYAVRLGLVDPDLWK